MARTGVLVLRHGGRVVADDKPLLTIPAIGEAVSRLHRVSRFGKVESVEAGVHGHVAVNLYLPRNDFPGGLVLEKVVKIIRFLLRREPRLIRDGGQKNRLLRVVGDDFLRIARLQRLVPPIE